ncbi:MAG TPA: glycosyltransferase [Gaiellaceae bacterium]|nr:glycosyltransferase [Gaiellaceae bacterium]
MSGVWLVHDYLTQRGGAERVALALTGAFPGAPLLTSFYDPATTFPGFAAVDVRTLPLDRIGPLRRRSRAALPVLAPAFAAHRVRADVVVCSSSGWAHLVRTSGAKIVYCHSPAKWLYRPDDYLGARAPRQVRAALAALAPALRAADRRGAATADLYVANSTFVQGQIADVYGIDAEIVFPPAGLDADGPQQPVPDLEPGFLLTVARLLPYKHVLDTVEAFRQLPARRLVVVGDGPQRPALEAALPPNVTLLTEVGDDRLRWLYASCSGLVSASREDFGLTPVEAASFGKPVAALRFGGHLDTVVDGRTGVYFDTPTTGAIADAVHELERRSWDAAAIREHARAFGEQRFGERMRELVARVSASARGGR